MANNRQKLEKKIRANKEKIKKLNLENIDLHRQSILLSDEQQWYSEKVEVVGRGKNKKECLLGRVHWNQDFTDEADGQVITVERSAVVKVDGKWEW